MSRDRTTSIKSFVVRLNQRHDYLAEQMKIYDC